MKRSGPPRRDPAKTRDWQRRSARPLPAESPRRKSERPARRSTRLVVLARDRGCVADGIALVVDGQRFEVPHGQLPGHAPLEVNELQRGAGRASTYLDPDWCIALCPVAHRWATDHPELARRVGLAALTSEESPDPARRLRIAHGATR